MFRIPRSFVGFIALGLVLAVVLPASADSTPGAMRTDMKIQATGITVTASPAASLHPLTVESLAPAHAVEVHPYMAQLDTADTHSLWKPRTKILASERSANSPKFRESQVKHLLSGSVRKIGEEHSDGLFLVLGQS
jgi:hypothetical protein